MPAQSSSPAPVATLSSRSKTTRTRRGDLRNVATSLATKDDTYVQVLKTFVDSKQLEDPYEKLYQSDHKSGLDIYRPPYNLGTLIRLPRENNTLGQCVAAMITNTAGHGFGLEYIGPDGDKESEESLAEKDRLMGLLDYPNEDCTLREIIEREKADKETLGMGYFEVGRDESGLITMISHLPAHTMRITHRDREPTPVTLNLPRNGKIEKTTIQKHFRRFVQLINGDKRYFKEYGDPRKIDPATGQVNADLSFDQTATEVIYDPLYSPGEVYGIPRWVSQMPSVMGSREMELVNLAFFKENAIPAMALLVSGGVLTQDAIDMIEQVFTAGRGRDSMHRVAVIEVEADQTMASADGTLTAPKVDLKALQGERQEDALFLKYDEGCQGKIRSSFRLPPVFVGGSQDYTYASAKTSFEVAESQVFGPERNQTNDIFNNKILSTYKPVYWAFRLQPPKISDPNDVINAVKAFDAAGGMTMNTIIQLANEYFDLEMPTITDAWGDWPYAIVKQLVNNNLLKGLEEIANPPPVSSATSGSAPAASSAPKKDQTTARPLKARRRTRISQADVQPVAKNEGENV